MNPSVLRGKMVDVNEERRRVKSEVGTKTHLLLSSSALWIASQSGAGLIPLLQVPGMFASISPVELC